MIEPLRHIAKARRNLEGGHLLLTTSFMEQAAHEAYLAAFHAALAFIGSQTRKEPKTHSGTRSEFARFAGADPRIPRAFVAFLGNAYEWKTYADYDGGSPVSADEAAAALAKAAEMADLIESILP